MGKRAVVCRADVLLFSSAWCDRNPDDPVGYEPPPVSEQATLEYWVSRLEPLARGSHETLFVCCDRVGQEGRTTFCGTSCVISLRNGGASLLASLGCDEEGLLLVELEGRAGGD